MKSRYTEQFRDPRWQRMRLEVLNRENFTCQACRSTTKTLNVHHTYYAKGRAPWEYEPESLRVLCEDCHLSTHETIDELHNAIAVTDPGVLRHLLGYVRCYSMLWSGKDADTTTFPVASEDEILGAFIALAIRPGDDTEDLIRRAVANGGVLLRDLCDLSLAQSRRRYREGGR